MIFILIRIIGYLETILTLIILADVILSYFMSPWHPVKRTLDRIVEPMLTPIRRILPTIGMIDFSPVVLLLAVQLISYILRQILFRLA